MALSESNSQVAMKAYTEYREGAIWRDVSSRGKIRVTGEDRARLLHAMTTNDIRTLKPGGGCYAFFLSAQGRVLADVHVLCREEDFLLDTEPETSARLYEHLDKFIIADDVTLEDLRGTLSALSLEGPRAVEVAKSAFGEVPPGEFDHRTAEGRMLARISLSGAPGFLIFMEPEQKPDLIASLQALGAVEADKEAFHVVRLEHGKPRYGEDITERYLTQETNQMQAVSFSKGCYLGQEIVERVRSRAQIHRRLLPLRIEANPAPPPGTKFGAEGKDLVEVTSAAWSPALGISVGLGYVRIELNPGDRVTAGQVEATIGHG